MLHYLTHKTKSLLAYPITRWELGCEPPPPLSL